MNDYLRYILYELENSLGLVMLALILAIAVIAVIYLVFKKKHGKEKKFPWGKIVLSLIFAGYLLIVIYATLLRGQGTFIRVYNLHLFRAWREAWNKFSVMNWANVLLNVALFVPLGGLLPLLWQKCRKWYVTLPIGFGASLAIELVQLAFCLGSCDVDDLFTNTLGAIIGYFSIMAFLSLFNEKGHKAKPCLTYGCIALVPILAIGSIFIGYHVKTYGNLAKAPSYTKNTKGVSWTLACELPSAKDTAAVYRTQTRNQAQCDAFANELVQDINTTVALATYYQESAYYNLQDPTGILSVNYYDGSYEFMIGSHEYELTWIEADRETIEDALAIFPVDIPATADFCYEGDGWHSFTVHQYIDGSLMYDGTLRVRYASDGNVYSVENYLCDYAYYSDVAILSPEEAYSQLKAGRFYDGEQFEYVHPAAITVTQYVLDYQIDTKGFYQPVYVFNLESPDGNYGYNVMIPAMK